MSFYITLILSHALDNLNLYSLLRRSFIYSLNITSYSRQFQFTFPLSIIDYIFLEYSFMLSIISIYILYSLNMTSCSRQFQFTFPTSMIIYTFLEYYFIPSL